MKYSELREQTYTSVRNEENFLWLLRFSFITEMSIVTILYMCGFVSDFTIMMHGIVIIDLIIIKCLLEMCQAYKNSEFNNHAFVF